MAAVHKVPTKSSSLWPTIRAAEMAKSSVLMSLNLQGDGSRTALKVREEDRGEAHEQVITPGPRGTFLFQAGIGFT